MKRPSWRTPPAIVMVKPNATATTPNKTWISARRQPRTSGTRRSSSHQKTKNVTLLRAMNAACITKAPRSISAALRFVTRSVRANFSVFDVDIWLPSIYRQRRGRASKDQPDRDGDERRPHRDVAEKRQHLGRGNVQDERGRPRQHCWKRREPRHLPDEIRIEVE